MTVSAGETAKNRINTALRLLLENESFLDQRWLEEAGQLSRGLRLNSEMEQAALFKILPERIAAGTPYEPWFAFILAEDCYAPQERTEEAIQWYRRAREAALASEQIKFRTTAGDATLRLALLVKDQPGGTEQALNILDSTPKDAFSESATAELAAFRDSLRADKANL